MNGDATASAGLVVQDTEIQGVAGTIFRRTWPADHPRYVAVLVHGYGEHIGRYDHVAAALLDHGAAVYGPDHMGHGRSEGERVRIDDFSDVTADVHQVVEAARDEHPGAAVIMIGHSMGGLIATLYAQEHTDVLTALVLSGPVLGDWAAARELVAADPIPDVPIDPDTLSRDPAVGADYATDELVHHGSFQRVTLEALLTGMRRAANDADRIRLPVLYLHGEQDELVPIGPSQAAVAAFPVDVETHVYEGARHEILNETNKAEVLADVTAFVDRVLAS